MKRPATIRIALFLLPAAVSVFAATPSVRVAQFSGDRAAAISYTFDDGLRDQYVLAVPMLNEVGIKGTFFIIPGCVSATVEDAERRKNDKRAWGTITWDELRTMASQGHEIGSHTWDHPSLLKLTPDQIDAEFSRASDAIKKEIGRPPLTLAYPFNQTSPKIGAMALRHHVACRDFQLGVDGKSTTDQLNRWADQQVNDHTWGVLMVHAIGRGYAAFSDPEIFRRHLHYVKSREAGIWVDTFANVARYAKERDDAKIEVSRSGSNGVTCTLIGTLDPAVYDVPLTLVADVSGAAYARAERRGRALPVWVSPGSIRVDAVPSKDPIVITWQ